MYYYDSTPEDDNDWRPARIRPAWEDACSTCSTCLGMSGHVERVAYYSNGIPIWERKNCPDCIGEDDSESEYDIDDIPLPPPAPRVEMMMFRSGNAMVRRNGDGVVEIEFKRRD